MEVLDYYHVCEHITDLIELFPKANLENIKEAKVYKKLSNYIWTGQQSAFITTVNELGKGNMKAVNKALRYFRKHRCRTKYQKLRNQNLPCGSGIVESAIRRIINLRFKCPSSFWIKENVENLIFLRANFLAGRWDILMNNLMISLK